jgi:hypothetical protein
MTKMGLTPIYQHPKTGEPHPRHKSIRIFFGYGITGASAGS